MTIKSGLMYLIDENGNNPSHYVLDHVNWADITISTDSFDEIKEDSDVKTKHRDDTKSDVNMKLEEEIDRHFGAIKRLMVCPGWMLIANKEKKFAIECVLEAVDDLDETNLYFYQSGTCIIEYIKFCNAIMKYLQDNATNVGDILIVRLYRLKEHPSSVAIVN